MTSKLQQYFLSQLQNILDEYSAAQERAKYDDLSDLGLQVASAFTTRASAAAERISGQDSPYSERIREILARQSSNDFERLLMIMGVVQSLYEDVKGGYIASVSELMHGEVFADLLEMAEHLQSEGYKDAAAVIAGGTLESHLRQLCEKYGIDTQIGTSSGVQPKRADRMNADLAKAGVYSKLDLKNVTAWLDLRNKAAHAHYDEYRAEQVALFIAGLRDFITRHPA